MKVFDYSFLQQMALPQGLSGLLSSLASLNGMFNKRLAVHSQRYEKVQADALEHTARAAEWLGGRASDYRAALKATETLSASSLTAENYLHIVALLAPETNADDKEKSQALGLAFSAYQQAQREGVLPLLLIPCLVLDVICISPLQVPSELPALLLVRLLMADKQYHICKYTSLESMICKYYGVYRPIQLRAASHWADNGNEYLPYIEIFLSMLYLSFKSLEAPAGAGRMTKRARVEALINSSSRPISKGEICSALPDVSPTTVEAALGAMVKSGTVRRIGATRGARYVAVDALESSLP